MPSTWQSFMDSLDLAGFSSGWIQGLELEEPLLFSQTSNDWYIESFSEHLLSTCYVPHVDLKMMGRNQDESDGVSRKSKKKTNKNRYTESYYLDNSPHIPKYLLCRLTGDKKRRWGQSRSRRTSVGRVHTWKWSLRALVRDVCELSFTHWREVRPSVVRTLSSLFISTATQISFW